MTNSLINQHPSFRLPTRLMITAGYTQFFIKYNFLQFETSLNGITVMIIIRSRRIIRCFVFSINWNSEFDSLCHTRFSDGGMLLNVDCVFVADWSFLSSDFKWVCMLKLSSKVSLWLWFLMWFWENVCVTHAYDILQYASKLYTTWSKYFHC